jgi:hypothetical protein
LRQNFPPDRYRTIEVSVFSLFTTRLALSAAFLSAIAYGQSTPAEPAPGSPATPAAVTADAAAKADEAKPAEIQPDQSDAGVVRARQNLDRVRALVTQGVLPPINLSKAQDDLNDALDMSILRFAAFTSDLRPEQADQIVTVAERMYLRRQKRAIETQQLVASGVLARSEADATGSDLVSAKLQLDLAIDRAHLVKDLALQRSLAEAETDAESHPEAIGKLYTRYEGKGAFTRSDFDKISAAYMAHFGHVIPVSADGQTMVHRSMGLNHAGRVDIALSPDQPEGVWLLHYLERNHIPYYAFKAAVAHKATGAHIHLGTGSTRLAVL